MSYTLFCVSIPQGTIKSAAVQLIHLCAAEFQFHKVRLKDAGMCLRRRAHTVSIPQGTIKRPTVLVWICKFCRVSIPQGTIKSNRVRAVEKIAYQRFNSTRYD